MLDFVDVHRVSRVVLERTHLFEMLMRTQYIHVVTHSLATHRLLRFSALSPTASY